VNTILLVDDDAAYRKAFRSALKQGRYVILEARSGQEALSVVHSSKIDLIILDCMMPEGSCYEVLDRIKGNSATKNIPVIVVSAQNDFSRVEQALAAGAQDFIRKPLAKKEARSVLSLKVKNLLCTKNAIDLLEQKLKSSQLLTNLDDVTSLFNYRHFRERLHAEFTRSRRYHRSLSLVMIDLDNLKAINDAFGHQAGTMLISMVGGIIENQCRSTDIPVRYGGDEFCIIVPEANLEEAVILSERLRLQIEAFGAGIDFEGTAVTASIGIVTQKDAGQFDSEDAFLKAADDACYEAKKIGRNLVCCHIDGKIIPAKDVVNLDASVGPAV
jgi:diguanylate cyclase (GGDEF)-like protein